MRHADVNVANRILELARQNRTNAAIAAEAERHRVHGPGNIEFNPHDRHALLHEIRNMKAAQEHYMDRLLANLEQMTRVASRLAGMREQEEKEEEAEDQFKS